MKETESYILSAEGEYIEGLYRDFKQDPNSVDESWRKFFEGVELGVRQDGAGAVSSEEFPGALKVYKLIEGYRSRAHLFSKTNPIRERKDRQPHLDLKDYELSEKDLQKEFFSGGELGLGKASLQTILEKLNNIYGRSIGIEYTHINNTRIREWVRKKFEREAGNINFPLEKKKRILYMLNQAVVFENFLNTKYVGQKRFSLEGGENTIPALDAIINQSSVKGVKEVVIGMAHRGRLNVLANTLGKTYEYIFSEFEGDLEPDLTMGDGDVKYHLGFSSQVTTPKGKNVFVKLAPNPSHLESVDPVVEGYARASSDLLYNKDRQQVLPLLLHGDAAIAGQGVAYEVAQMAGLEGYNTGGTIHFVINNQIGFTTDFVDARTSDYCTSLAKVTDCPVLHVNGDDAEAIVFAVEFAVEFRQKFGRDIFVDMLCYRKHGHNEGDEPKITQPNLYKLISKHPDPREVYSNNLINQGDIEAKMAKDMQKQFKKLLQDRLNMVKQKPLPHEYQQPDQQWKNLRRAGWKDFDESPDTSISKEDLDKILKALITVPEDFSPIRQVQKMLKKREEAIKNDRLDWALGELSAYGSLLLDHRDVRLSGQDSVRGTFAHRHAKLFDERDNRPYNNLDHIAEKQGDNRVYNSLLSEYAVLGFEYGYSLGSPNCLTIWEAQFGDFVNGAQNIIDQYITPGESKWQKMSGLVMFLPHGYEGQGPEHSNARLERFLQLAAELNIIVANCSTPANFFHILRRQMIWKFRKPLVVMTPKSLLRHPRCVSPSKDFIQGKFREVLDDANAQPKKVKKVLFCSGKVYYDLLARKENDKREDVALVRVEQLYPLPEKQLNKIFNRYSGAQYGWVQEEPQNMGSWTYLLRYEKFCKQFKLISRKASASPATGFAKVHNREQKKLIEKAFA